MLFAVLAGDESLAVHAFADAVAFYEQALAAGEASLRLAKAQNLREQMTYAANDLVYVYMALGNNRRTAEMEELATDLWRELGNQPMLTDSLVNLASTKALMGAFDEALAIAEEPLTISQSLDKTNGRSLSAFSSRYLSIVVG